MAYHTPTGIIIAQSNLPDLLCHLANSDRFDPFVAGDTGRHNIGADHALNAETQAENAGSA
jgi:hypothetical protein